MVRREAPPTIEGWYALHDMRTIDWREWAEAPQRARDRAIEEGQAFLDSAVAVEDAEEGATVVYSMLGHEADLMIVHLRPTVGDVNALERRFEQTALAGFTERSTSFVSVTEASGYSEKGRQFIEGDLDDDSGLANYMRSRLYPQIPDADHVCFYPMDKRRDPEYNWYDLPFDERAEHMDVHGEIGREYAGKVTQMITGSIGFDDWEWGVTLWANDLTNVKQLLYEMRFDPSSSKYAEFGSFYVGSQMDPAELPAFLAGEHLGDADGGGIDADRPATPEDAAADSGHSRGDHPHGRSGHADGQGEGGHHAEAGQSAHGDHPHGDTDESHGDEGHEDDSGGGGGRPPTTDSWSESITETESLGPRSAEFGVDAPEDAYGLCFESDRDADGLREEVEGLASNFDHYDTHHGTAVHDHDGATVLVSLWDNEDAAQTAAGFLTDVDGVDAGSRGHLDGGADGHEETDNDHEETADDDADTGSSGGRPSTPDSWGEAVTEVEDLTERLASAGIHEGDAYEGGAYGLLFETDREARDLAAEVEGLVENFDHYDTHHGTMVRANHGQTVLISLWDTEDAALTASGFLTDLDGIDTGTRGHVGTPSEDADESQSAGTDDDQDIRAELAEQGIYAGQPHGEDVYAMVLYSTADPETLFKEVSGLRDRFDHYDTHVKTAVYATDDAETTAAVSLWETADAAETASDYLGDLPEVVRRAGEGAGFGTMGMFYTVKPDYREEFVDTFADVGDILEEMDGHRETALLANHEDAADMFIASRWDAKEDAMQFFRSSEFRDTVKWGREVLADTPRHVFLA